MSIKKVKRKSPSRLAASENPGWLGSRRRDWKYDGIKKGRRNALELYGDDAVCRLSKSPGDKWIRLCRRNMMLTLSALEKLTAMP